MIDVFVGCAANGEDAESLAVLEYSIRKHASQPVRLHWMKQTHDPESFWWGWDTTRWATPFSGFRWGIPAAMNYTGRAIYCDSDVIWLADVAELFAQRFNPGSCLMGKGGGSWRFCVSMWDCEAARSELPPIDAIRHDPGSHHKLCQTFRRDDLVTAFRGDWNCLDGDGHAHLNDGELKVLHYTDMSCQPHLRHALPRLAAAGRRHWFDGTVRRHPRADVEALFDEYLAAAIAAGFDPATYIPNGEPVAYRKASLVGYRGRAQ